MKLGIFLIKNGKGERLAALPFCDGCHKPIENLKEANVCPRMDDVWDEPAVLRRGLSQITSEAGVFHWKCDPGHTPWKNLYEALLDAVIVPD